MRLAIPMILYLPISFLFAMISLPFKVDFGAHYTYAGGFFLWAFTLYLGMSAVGLATEFAITILGPKFMGFFLIPLIIANVSVASLPHELQPWIYRYGVAMPFYNVGRVVRTVSVTGDRIESSRVESIRVKSSHWTWIWNVGPNYTPPNTRNAAPFESR
jgi:hypothetical protein